MSKPGQRVEPDGHRDAREGQHHADKPPRCQAFIGEDHGGHQHAEDRRAALKMEVSPVSMNCCPQAIRPKGIALLRTP
jgi:hypothetical protein